MGLIVPGVGDGSDMEDPDLQFGLGEMRLARAADSHSRERRDKDQEELLMMEPTFLSSFFFSFLIP